MPRGRRKAGGASSAFRQIQKLAKGLLGNLRKQLRAAEVEVRRLKEEESRLGALMGRSAGGAAPAARGGGVGRGRVNWRAVLGQLPKQFKASHVRQVRGLKAKRPSEIFAAVTRWMDAGLVKRKARGLYERS